MTPLLILLLVGCTQSFGRVANYNLDVEDFDLDDFDGNDESDSLEIDDRSIDYGDYYAREALPFTETCEIKFHNFVPKGKSKYAVLKNVTCESTYHYERLGRPTTKRDFCIIQHQQKNKNEEICKTEYVPLSKLWGMKNAPQLNIGVGCKGCFIGLKHIKTV